MKNKNSEHKTSLLPIAGNIELLIGYDEVTQLYPFSEEECHGIQLVDQSDVEIILTSVEIVIGGIGIDVLGKLTYPMKEEIIDILKD